MGCCRSLDSNLNEFAKETPILLQLSSKSNKHHNKYHICKQRRDWLLLEPPIWMFVLEFLLGLAQMEQGARFNTCCYLKGLYILFIFQSLRYVLGETAPDVHVVGQVFDIIRGRRPIFHVDFVLSNANGGGEEKSRDLVRFSAKDFA